MSLGKLAQYQVRHRYPAHSRSHAHGHELSKEEKRLRKKKKQRKANLYMRRIMALPKELREQYLELLGFKEVATETEVTTGVEAEGA